MRDWISLFYIWFMILSTFHMIIIYDWRLFRLSSHFLNVNIFLPVSSVFAFPYIFYILGYTKPENIIDKIFNSCIRDINQLVKRRDYVRTLSPLQVEEYQRRLFAALNQLDDILCFTQFKETKSVIIGNFRRILEVYINAKPHLPENIYAITPTMKSDISFRATAATFVGQERYDQFFEKKCFRMLGNSYKIFNEEDLYDLASLCASEMVSIGDSALQINDDEILNLIQIHLNTFFRLALKHALKINEPRNLYNLAYHYRLFLEKLVEGNRSKILIQGFYYLQFYGNEIYKNVAEALHLYFIIDIIVFEMKMILMTVYEKNFDRDVQRQLLLHFLQVDKPPEMIDDEVGLVDHGKSKARWIQVSVGLYYMSRGEQEFVDMVIDDIMDDVAVMGERRFQNYFDRMFELMKHSDPTFWEDTDRGNINIYYTDNQEYIDSFRDQMHQKMLKQK
jgi:hypothetical protein